MVKFPRTETWRWMKRTVIGCLTCRSNGLMGGPWPMKPAIYSRPSAVSLKVWLRETRAPLTSIVGKKITMDVNGAPELLCFPHSSEYLPLCSAEQRHSYRFGTTWGRVNDDRIFIFGWTIPSLTSLTSNDFLSQLHQKVWWFSHEILSDLQKMLSSLPAERASAVC